MLVKTISHPGNWAAVAPADDGAAAVSRRRVSFPARRSTDEIRGPRSLAAANNLMDAGGGVSTCAVYGMNTASVCCDSDIVYDVKASGDSMSIRYRRAAAPHTSNGEGKFAGKVKSTELATVFIASECDYSYRSIHNDTALADVT
ncbi:hypothetical protein EYF80_041763 [Liparis tanakae]|uniref:Uncharacterized protein n=1 Tax=Liparis tanakae TaxID=230148 RepID=A0A4Z2G3E1_9TELE|nr:hypothetical protein EYF80_041763 [Liparis tanakae]